MFHDMEQKLKDTIDLFRSRGATSPKKALNPEELGLPPMFKYFVHSPFGSRLPFVETNGKFYLSEEKVAAIGDLKDMFPPHMFGGWLKHTARVPRGYLRYKVLALLREETLSGSEIAKRLEDEAGGRWKPSPGSLYPLLKALLKEGFTEEQPDVDLVRKYTLTEMGRVFLREQSDMVDKMRERLESGPFPPFLDLPENLLFLPEKSRPIFDALLRIVEALSKNPDQEHTDELAKILETFAKRLEQLAERLES